MDADGIVNIFHAVSENISQFCGRMSHINFKYIRYLDDIIDEVGMFDDEQYRSRMQTISIPPFIIKGDIHKDIAGLSESIVSINSYILDVLKGLPFILTGKHKRSILKSIQILNSYASQLKGTYNDVITNCGIFYGRSDVVQSIMEFFNAYLAFVRLANSYFVWYNKHYAKSIFGIGAIKTKILLDI